MKVSPHACWLLPLVLTGCPAATNTQAPVDPGDVDKRVPIHRLEPITIAGYTQSELMAEFEQARSLLLVDKFAPAAKAFDRLMRLAVESSLAAPSAYNSGVAYEGLGRRDEALERYLRVADKHPKDPTARQALIRATRLLGYLERWAQLERTADRLLARERELPVMDRIEALGAKALAQVEQGQTASAQRFVTKAVDLIEQHRFGQGGTPPVQLAQVSFAQGEIRRLESERIKLVPVTADFAMVLERRCQGLLDAQSAYTDAMRSRDAHWSAMSGYRVGQLYQQLHRETSAIPPPKKASLSDKKRKLFAGAMRLRYRILLQKGLKMMRGTVRLGDRTGESSFWVTRAREAVTELERSLAAEKAAIAKLPYTEDELRAALAKLKKDAKAAKKAP